MDFLIWKDNFGSLRIRKVDKDKDKNKEGCRFSVHKGEFPVYLSQEISLRYGRFSNRKTSLYILFERKRFR